MKQFLSLIKGGPSDEDSFITGDDHFTQVTIWAEIEDEVNFDPVVIGSFVKEQYENPAEIVREYIEIAREDDHRYVNFTTEERFVAKPQLKVLMHDTPRFGGKL